MKTSELQGAALDWAVALCQNVECDEDEKPIWFEHDGADAQRCLYSPSTDWAQGGTIIAREGFSRIVTNLGHGYTVSKKQVTTVDDDEVIRWVHGAGSTILIAAMRCYVASKLGDEVDVPEALDTHV